MQVLRNSVSFQRGGVKQQPCLRRQSLIVRAVAVKIPSKYSQVSPKADHVLVKVSEVEEASLGGILLPAQAQRRPTTGEVQAVGDGNVAQKKPWTFTVKQGETVLYSKFGFTFTELDIKGDEYILIKEQDIIGIMPAKDATADDIPKLQPLGDRVLIKIDESSEVSSGGVFLPSSGKDKPQSGVVVRTGAGKIEDDGNLKKVSVKEGDRVVYFKYAGDDMETTDGKKYVVVHQTDILCKA
eukprot:TRINITY_DN4351_c0_g1_i1.p1 TRINITY_DN4351_c0_g1~~TRINITY_DN4351_c0_g1_i1.p1  ORF type:complete len:240 (-),score=54.71 TRINITY_DN4351_c0_g1_i1:198-917(-)